MVLSWNDKGKYKAELLNHREHEPVVVIRTEDQWGNEIVLRVSYDGNIKLPSGGVSKSHVRISSHGPIALDLKDYKNLQRAISEARAILRKIKARGRVIHYTSGNKTLCGVKRDNKTWCGLHHEVNCTSCKNLMLYKKIAPGSELVAGKEKEN